MPNNYLMHYRTPGSLNGRTKYPGKYNPIGELAKGAKDFYNDAKQNGLGNAINNKVDDAKNYITEQVIPKIEEKATVALGPKVIQDEMSKSANSAIENLTKPNTQTYAKLEDDFKTFIKNDIKDRINVKSNVAKLRAAKRMKGIADRAIYDPRTKEKLREAVSSDYKNIPQAIAKSITDPRNTKDYASIALDAAIPTYKGSKATTEDNFTTFIKNDIKDRLNKKIEESKKNAVNSFSKKANAFLTDSRVQKNLKKFRQNPESIKNIDVTSAKRIGEAALDAAIPTYEKSKAKLDDDLITFIKNDIKDRKNNVVKKGKNKVKKLMSKWFG